MYIYGIPGTYGFMLKPTGTAYSSTYTGIWTVSSRRGSGGPTFNSYLQKGVMCVLLDDADVVLRMVLDQCRLHCPLHPPPPRTPHCTRLAIVLADIAVMCFSMFLVASSLCFWLFLASNKERCSLSMLCYIVLLEQRRL